ncbi:MAG: hypothetical protein IKL37_05120 [Alphaproteobacteria bacterium]|nr:hypothetical protein [Alphaproteobacteria bacterium]
MRYDNKIIHIPDEWNTALNDLKQGAIQWRMEFCSHTEQKTIGHISHYSIDKNATNCLILVPGLASNTDTEPLMRVITYWALVNNHDVYCLDTFWGRFLPTVSQELAQQQTFEEYINLIDTGMDRIETECKNHKYSYSCVIGHSAGATATLEIYNRRILQHKKLRFSASIMFAPYVDKSFIEYITNFFVTHRSPSKEPMSVEEIKRSAIGLVSPHEPRQNNQVRYLSVLPTVYSDVDSVRFCPEIMDKYGIPITLVAGGRDRKSPPNELRKKYNILREGKNGNLWKFVVFKNSRHGFIDQYKDWGAILRLIQSQKQFARKHTK